MCSAVAALVAFLQRHQVVPVILSVLVPLTGIGFGKFDWTDPFRLDSQLTEDELLISQSTREYCQSKLLPRVLEGFRHESKQAETIRAHPGRV